MMQTPFSSLSRQGQVRRMARLARRALDGYPLDGSRLRLLTHLWNTTFHAVAPDGSRYVLRIHHPGQTSVESVRSELLWLAALRRETDLQVPEPVPNNAGSLVVVAADPGVPKPRLCVLFRWVEGRFVYRRLTPAHLFQVGKLMALLQRHASSWRRPDRFTRHRVDNLDPMRRGQDDRFDEACAARAVDLVSAVSTPEAGTVVAAVVHKVWAVLHSLGQGPDVFGLIHADMHYRNFLFHQGSVGAIDFDDCGYGHWLYDLAVPLTELQRHPGYVALRQALLAGYRQNRSLSVEHEAHLESFMALRRLQNLIGFIEEREHPAFRDEWRAAMDRELQGLRAFAGQPPPAS
jgi:Ser/Thr protein kinase RdoA (MazF antagonist)